jgi:hypothetical protein
MSSGSEDIQLAIGLHCNGKSLISCMSRRIQRRYTQNNFLGPQLTESTIWLNSYIFVSRRISLCAYVLLLQEDAFTNRFVDSVIRADRKDFHCCTQVAPVPARFYHRDSMRRHVSSLSGGEIASPTCDSNIISRTFFLPVD